MFNALLKNIQGTIQSMVKKVLERNGNSLKKIYKRDIKKLETAVKKNFLRINYEEAVELLNKHGYSKVQFGDDLKADHEARIVQLLNKKGEELPVFITKYP